MLGNELLPLVDEPRLGNEATGSLTSRGSVTRSYGLVDEPRGRLGNEAIGARRKLTHKSVPAGT